MVRIGYTLLLISIGSTNLMAADWTQFRGSGSQGIAAATELPLSWNSTKNVRWTQPIPGKGWSSPILLGGRLYLTTAVPLSQDASAPLSLRALCLEADSGKVIWDIEVFQQAAGSKIHTKNSHASPTPITDGKRLFVHFGTNGTACLNLDGQIVWTNRELKYAPVHGSGGSPVLWNGVLIVSCDGADLQFVVALDQQNGTIRWKTPRDTKPTKGFSFGTPLVIEAGGRAQLISQASDAVFAYDPADGKTLWKVRYHDGYSVVPRPVFGQGLLFVCTGYNTPSLLAIRPDGSGDVTESHVVWKTSKAVPKNPSPLLVGEELYIVADNGVATCLEARTGEEIWQARIGGNFSASPVYAAGRIYLQSEEGEGIVLKAGRQFEELARNPLGEKTLASYAVAERALFIRSENNLRRIEDKVN